MSQETDAAILERINRESAARRRRRKAAREELEAAIRLQSPSFSAKEARREAR